MAAVPLAADNKAEPAAARQHRQSCPRLPSDSVQDAILLRLGMEFSLGQKSEMEMNEPGIRQARQVVPELGYNTTCSCHANASLVVALTALGRVSWLEALQDLATPRPGATTKRVLRQLRSDLVQRGLAMAPAGLDLSLEEARAHRSSSSAHLCANSKLRFAMQVIRTSKGDGRGKGNV